MWIFDVSLPSSGIIWFTSVLATGGAQVGPFHPIEEWVQARLESPRGSHDKISDQTASTAVSAIRCFVSNMTVSRGPTSFLER